MVVPIAVAFLLTFYTPLAWWIAEPLRIIEQPQPADAIVVFAGGVGESGKAGGGVQERVGRAVAAVSGGSTRRRSCSRPATCSRFAKPKS